MSLETKEKLTTLLLDVSLPRLPEGHHGSAVSPQHSPAEGGHRVDADQAADEGVSAALQQSYDVRPHVVRVLLPEILSVEEERNLLNEPLKLNYL